MTNTTKTPTLKTLKQSFELILGDDVEQTDSAYYLLADKNIHVQDASSYDGGYVVYQADGDTITEKGAFKTLTAALKLAISLHSDADAETAEAEVEAAPAEPAAPAETDTDDTPAKSAALFWDGDNKQWAFEIRNPDQSVIYSAKPTKKRPDMEEVAYKQCRKHKVPQFILTNKPGTQYTKKVKAA